MFTPHTEKDVEAMLKSIGAKSVEELFNVVPADYRFPELDLPPAATEMEIMGELQELADADGTTQNMLCFLGAGAYDTILQLRWICCCAVVNFTQPTPPTSPKFPRVHCKQFLNTRACFQNSLAWM